MPSNTDEFHNRFYTGASFGQSRLNPETAGTDFRVESASDSGTQLRLGYDVHNILAIELDTALLGSSALGQANTGVEYSAATLSALIYGSGGTQMRSRREGLSSFVRLGYGQLSKVSIVENFDRSESIPVLGLGAEYGFANGIGVRTEITRFDSDVSYVGIGAIFRFGTPGESVNKSYAQASVEPVETQVVETTPVVHLPVLPVQPPEALLKHKMIDVAEPELITRNLLQPEPSSQGSLADRWRPTKRLDDSDSDGVLNDSDACPSTVNFVTVGSDGCGLFDQILEDVTFAKNSRVLDAAARNQLDWVADTLLAFPESRIKIHAHTDSGGPARGNMILSSRRAKAVAQYFRSRGVSQTQLQSVGMGETLPIASNKTHAGRMKNRRVELLTLPDLDAQRLSAELLTLPDLETEQPSVELPTIEPVVVSRLVASNQFVGHPRENNRRIKNELNGAEEKLKPALQSKEIVSSVSKANKEPAILAAKVIELPVPGHHSGIEISGVVDGVVFESGSIELSDSSSAALEPLKKVLLENPTIAIAVMAHSDDAGSDLDNEKLTMLQANSIIEFLTKGGVDFQRMQAEGYGGQLPLVQNVTDEDRARNRRIEIRILPSWPKQ